MRVRPRVAGSYTGSRFVYSHWMSVCKGCGEEVDALVVVKDGKKSKKLCEDCADRAREAGEIAEASEGVVQNMMEFKGRR